MTKKLKTPRSTEKHSTQVANARRAGSRTHTVSATIVARAVTPTSEQIIKETSMKRRKAIQLLAKR